MSNDSLGLACEHGMLARACEVCEMENEITALRAEVEELRAWQAQAVKSCSARGCETLPQRLRESDAHNDELRSQLSARDAEVRALREAVQTAYGFLWCVNNEPGTPHRYSPENAAYEARKVLRDLLTNEQRGAGINAAIAVVRATPLLTGEPGTGGENAEG